MEFINNLGELLISLKDGVLYYVPGVGRPDRVAEFLWGHLLITFVTLFFALLISLPLGILITRVRALYDPVIKLTGMLYTVPSLAMFGLMIPLVGIGFTPSVIALTLYSLLAIVRNTAVGIDSVDPAIIEAAQGMGMTKRSILLQVELPLALPIIFAGIRIAVVSTISLATLASYFGASSLGKLIFEGIAAGGGRNDKVAAGAIGAALLAVLFDVVISKIERSLPGATSN
ncbi:MAG: ABC transporter permease [Cyanobacteria bacterium P01_H01_bin.21]